MTGRYLSTREFGRLLADLKIRENIFQDQILEFLECERMVVPVARIRWPRGMIVEDHDGIPDPPVTAEARAEADALMSALRRWRGPDAEAEAEHPLDVVGSPGASLITKDVAVEAFEAWELFRTEVPNPGHPGHFADGAVDTYYHDWQALLVADAVETGVRVIVDTRRTEVNTIVHNGSLAELQGFPKFREIPYWAPRGLTTGTRWSGYFDAAARTLEVRRRKLWSISLHHVGPPAPVSEIEQVDLDRAQRERALQALDALGATEDSVVEFIRYLCERWGEWRNRDRSLLAAEYRRQIALATNMAMTAYSLDRELLAQRVGRVTGHFGLTLDAVFPDWWRGARERLEQALQHSVLPNAPAAGALSLTSSDVTDLCDWLERRQSFRVALSIAEIIRRQFSGDPVDREALSKEVQSLGDAVELLLNDMFREVGVPMPDQLMAKMRRFWREDSEVSGLLTGNRGLVATWGETTRADQLLRIAAIPPGVPQRELGQTLLRVVLNRNVGTHQGTTSWTEPELHDATRDFLSAMMFCRKQMLLNPPRPTP
ncbi:hypothetical protein [Neoroseomonas lacus]|uniref:Uncharacterized protein n=1 Tax=Neoroseomonas lacus TaxID=287609 RepID=A0A917K852_9PROT|nr:hypothetical protein [Neoroseomonas lacus]GGJ04600.1 hypothetical protein GCM10011320_09360 [Neoroseomonas lacus]